MRRFFRKCLLLATVIVPQCIQQPELRRWASFFVLVLSLCSDSVSGSEKATRIACVGNSITYGYGIANRDADSYPARLQGLLGDRFDVRNFGKNGATVLHDGDVPYVEQPEYGEALRFLPEVVFIELGTNDSKPHNRKGLKDFEDDYLSIVRSFERLSTHPRIVLLLPPPVFSDDSAGITNAVIRDRILPSIRAVAFQTGCEVVNLYNQFLDASSLFADNIHPSSKGASLIAVRLRDLLTMETVKGFDVLANAAIAGPRSSYYGFTCTDFTFEGREAKVVAPKTAAKGCPWLWRARFWGHEPQTEIALLERGFHVVFCDVAELFGNPEALRIWDMFYAKLVQGGLSERAVLEGFSRGGVYVYRWAAEYPQRVACVYVDAPVLDLKSWPGGKGRGHGNPVEWERFKTNFGLKTEQEALAFKGNPLDLAERIAKAKFPMLHVCGTADETVPIEENTDPFEKRVLAAGGNITVIRKPGVGHHPHSLPNPQPIVEFILHAVYP